MKRRTFLGSTVGGTLAGLAINVGAQEGGEPEGNLMTTPAVVMAPREDGVEVVWGVSRLCRGAVEWRGADGSAGKVAADDCGFVPQADRLFRVKITGLKPGQRFELRAVTDTVENEQTETTAWKPFRTLDGKAEKTHFVVWNDTHERDETIQRLNEVTPAADFLLWNGDTCNDWHQEEWLIPTILNPGKQDLSKDRPLLVTYGNHDVRGKWAFKLREMIASPSGDPFYAFRSGPVAVICLHTGEDKPDDHPSFQGRVAFEPLRAKQADWLKEVINRPEMRDAPYRIVFCHIPLRWTDEVSRDHGFDWYSKRSRDHWHEALVQWKTQVVISGHTHRAAWIPANEDFPYAQLTGGGPQLDRATWLEGVADGQELKLVMRNLKGEVVNDVRIAAS